MKSNEQKLIDLLVQSVLTVRTDKCLQRATTEQLINWIRDNLTKIGFNVQEGNQVWIDYDGSQPVKPEIFHEAVPGKMRFFVQDGPETAPVEIKQANRAQAPDRNAQIAECAIDALQEIRKLDFTSDPNGHVDLYSGAPKFVRAWLIADEAIKKIEVMK